MSVAAQVPVPNGKFYSSSLFLPQVLTSCLTDVIDLSEEKVGETDPSFLETVPGWSVVGC
jgi:hypothetical protein